MRAMLVLVAMLPGLAGCSDEPGPLHPTAEEVALAYSPVSDEAPPEQPASLDDRQSRPAQAERQAEITPATWDGATDELVCVQVATSGCPGFVVNHDDSHALGVDGRSWRVRVTVTWDPVDEATRELEVRVLGQTTTGTSPLVVEAPYRSEREGRVPVSVHGVEGGVIVHLPSQPFHAVAEFNV